MFLLVGLTAAGKVIGNAFGAAGNAVTGALSTANSAIQNALPITLPAEVTAPVTSLPNEPKKEPSTPRGLVEDVEGGDVLCVLFSCERTLCSDSDEDEDSPVNALPMPLVRDPNALLIALPAEVTAPVTSLLSEPKKEPNAPNGFADVAGGVGGGDVRVLLSWERTLSSDSDEDDDAPADPSALLTALLANMMSSFFNSVNPPVVKNVGYGSNAPATSSTPSPFATTIGSFLNSVNPASSAVTTVSGSSSSSESEERVLSQLNRTPATGAGNAGGIPAQPPSITPEIGTTGGVSGESEMATIRSIQRGPAQLNNSISGSTTPTTSSSKGGWNPFGGKGLFPQTQMKMMMPPQTRVRY